METQELKESKIVPIEVCNLATALSKAQGVMQGAKKEKRNPFFNSLYADLSSVFDCIREPFASNSLSITQTMDILLSGQQALITKLMHSSGEFIESKMLLPIEPNPQKLGSCITYYRRYALMAIAGVPAEDDDGNQASFVKVAGKDDNVPKSITSSQVSDLKKLINGNTKINDMVLSHCKNDMASISVEEYPGAVKFVKELVGNGSQNDE